MLQVSIFHRNGRHLQSKTVSALPVTIGKGADCCVILKGWGMQKHHCCLDFHNGQGFLKPLNESHCFVNEDRIVSDHPVLETDSIRIASYRLTFNWHRETSEANHFSELATGIIARADAGQNTPDERPNQAQSDNPGFALKVQGDSAITLLTAVPLVSNASLVSATSLAATPPAIAQVQSVGNVTAPLSGPHPAELSWRLKIQGALLQYIDIRRIQLDELEEHELRRKMEGWIREIISASEDFPDAIDIASLIQQVTDEAVGLGPLEDLLRDDSISEIMVNAHDEIFFEKAGRLLKSAVCFSDQRAVLSAIERIVSPLGRRIDESSPMVDARLKDGSRVNAVIPPLALKGPCVTIRKFSKNRLHGEDLVRFGSMSEAMRAFLQKIVTGKQNMVISGGTGSGKTTLLNVLSSYIPVTERIITVEDAAELQLTQPNLVSLEARPANQEGKGVISIRDLVRNCLRMRPDRIVVGECRGGEALDMLQAMNTGHDGSLTTAHANTPRDCISRMEVMVLMAGMELPVSAIREQIASAVHYITQQTRFPCGSRKITSICEVNGLENGIVQLSEIFRFHQTGFDSNGRVSGSFKATGLIPEFFEQMARQGYPQDLSIFQQEEC